MRKLLRTVPMQVKARSTQATYDPEANNQRLKNWLGRLNNLASSGATKVYLSQLGVLVNYYNRVTLDNTQVFQKIFRKLIGMIGATELPPMALLKE